MFLEEGWIDISDTLDVTNTCMGLIIMSEVPTKINTSGINQFLSHKLMDVSSSSQTSYLNNLFSLRQLAISFKMLSDDKSLAVINNYVREIAKNLTSENINSLTTSLLSEVNLLSGSDENLVSEIPDETIDLIKKELEKIEKKEDKNSEDLLHYYLSMKFNRNVYTIGASEERN